MNESKVPIAGRILNIQHFCVDDGPGIRTTVFLKGCPLRCVWCHNPESHETTDEIMFRTERCTACGACARVCPVGAHSFDVNGKHLFDRTRCTHCGNCAAHCYVEALEAVGEAKTVEEVLKDVLSDRVFYETSNGGVTVSGGEPTAQARFTEALLAACKKEGLHTAMETCGWCSEEVLLRLIPHVDLFLLDWKLTDDTLHQRYTGVSNLPIRKNLALLEAHGCPIILRCPMIPDINLTDEHIDGIIALANQHANVTRIDLEPYHPMGIGKSDALGKSPSYRNTEFLEANDLTDIRSRIAKNVSVEVTISGK